MADTTVRALNWDQKIYKQPIYFTSWAYFKDKGVVLKMRRLKNILKLHLSFLFSSLFVLTWGPLQWGNQQELQPPPTFLTWNVMSEDIM